MHKTIEQATPEHMAPLPRTRSWNRGWASIVVVAVISGGIGLGLSSLDGSGTLTPQQIAEARYEAFARHQAELWASGQAQLTPQQIEALRYAQYPEAHRRLWESQRP
ncbi:MAG TPA: hypothetical protein VLB67_16345 [Acidimicrobiia bacterium]|nr:hypothetical protein [Acidimicrobiia bacterium]